MKSLLKEDQGMVLVYVTLLAGLLVGAGTLAVDVGRYTTLNSQLQHAADAAALAGARELDRLPGARARARAAAADAIGNVQDFGVGGLAVAIASGDCADAEAGAGCIRFLEDLPDSDALSMDTANVATNDEDARFIEIRVGNRTLNAFFASAIGGDSQVQTTASAVAGNDALMCSVTPMFMCRPKDAFGEPVPLDQLKGKQIRAFKQGAGGQWVPGNFGLLCPAGYEDQNKCGATDIAAMLASAFGTCVKRNGIMVKPGVDLNQTLAGINVRFDSYSSQAKDWRSLPGFHPAANVTQGMTPDVKGNGSCDRSTADPAGTMALPRDACHIAGTCGGPVGDGIWNYQDYFQVNHNTGGATPAGWAGLSSPPTRFEVYRAEIERGPMVPSGRIVQSGAGQCYTGPVQNQNYGYMDDKTLDLRLLQDRRVIPLVAVDCEAEDLSGKSEITNPDFVFSFLTEPMNGPPESTIYLEVLGPLDKSALDNLLRDVVQLYRR